ncbi:MAG TPA: alkaline phosphatase PhoX, partial [Thermoleophilaceae bacterium]
RPALGVFSHEYACVSESDRRVYLTEDQSGGGFYRFTPRRWGDLSEGVLEIATLVANGVVEWRVIPDPLAQSTPTRQQVASSRMARPEGLCVHRGTGLVYFVESSAGRVFQYDPRTETYERIYSESDFPEPELTDTDNIAVSELSRDLFVCEDAGDLDICLITPDGEVSRFVHLDGVQHGDPNTDASSETTGPSFDPSGTRLYFSSQRAFGFGVIYEVTGPFRRLPGPAPAPGGAAPLELRIHAYRRTLKSRLASQGFRVGVALTKAADVTVVLRAPVGAKGAPVTLAVGSRRGMAAGKGKLTLSLTRKGKGYLKRVGRPVTATIVATATTAGGERDVVERPMALR